MWVVATARLASRVATRSAPWRHLATAAPGTTAPAAPPLTPTASPSGAISAPRAKAKNNFKRASSVMAEIDRDARVRMALKMHDYRPPLPDFNVGDAVEITYAHEHSDVSPVPTRGVVIAKRRNGIDDNFTILNAWDDEWYTATYTLSSPLLRSVRIMMRNRHTDGEKRARRAKLNYLFDRDPKTYLVDSNTREAEDIAAEKQMRRELQKAGKVYKKVRPGATAAAARAAVAAAAGGKQAPSGGAKAGAGGKK